MFWSVVLLYTCFSIVSSNGYIRNVGTTLFRSKKTTDCWTEEDIAKLRARQLFEEIVPREVPINQIDQKYVHELLKYFHCALREVQHITELSMRDMLTESLADTFGAHLRSNILPAVRYAYYAGHVPYKETRQLHKFSDDIKKYLNTQGVGWKEPEKAQSWGNISVTKIFIEHGRIHDPCAHLILKSQSDSCIHLPLPKLDDDRNPTAIALPFKNGGFMSLTSPSSDGTLLKYYTNGARCILNNSPAKCRHDDFQRFNAELGHWLKRHIAPRLSDEVLYPAYGSVLRIAAVMKNNNDKASESTVLLAPEKISLWRHPVQYLSDSSICGESEPSSPMLYLTVVLLIAICIIMGQMLSSYFCMCRPRKTYSWRKCSKTNIPYSKIKEYANRDPTDKTRQNVYDLNDNVERSMVIPSAGTKTFSKNSPTESQDSRGAADKPPILETPIYQMRAKRKVVRRESGYKGYSTPVRSGNGDTLGSGSSSSESCSSATSATSPRCGLDFPAWRRAVSRRQSTNQLTSGEDTNIYSRIVTPSTKR